MNPKNEDFFSTHELSLLHELAWAKGCRSIWESCDRARGGGDCMPSGIANSGLEREYLEFQKNKNKKKKESYTLNEKVFDLYDKVQKLIHS